MQDDSQRAGAGFNGSPATPDAAPEEPSVPPIPRWLTESQPERYSRRSYDDAAISAEPIYLPVALSIGAGFKFGCGLLLSILFAALGLFVLVSVAIFVLSLSGVQIPIVPSGSP